jgi:hypothetical protein
MARLKRCYQVRERGFNLPPIRAVEQIVGGWGGKQTGLPRSRQSHMLPMPGRRAISEGSSPAAARKNPKVPNEMSGIRILLS